MSNEEIWDKFEYHLRNEGLSQKRIKTLYSRFNAFSRELDLKTATRKEIENWINKLNTDKIRKLNGSIVSGTTKQSWKKALKQFYKWYKGDSEFYPPEVSWIKTRIPKDEKPEEKPILELNQVVKLAQKFKKYEYKIATLILFDSGFRIQELMSCKKKDLTWDDFDNGEKCFWIKCNQSKTYVRKIPIPLFTPEIRSFFESSYFRALDDDDLLFNMHYDSYRRLMIKYATDLFFKDDKNKKHITPHCLRHSSATYYAKEYSGNVPLLAQRFGWSYSAVELQTYVRKSGAYNREGAKVSFKNSVSKLQEENAKIKEEMKAIQEKLKLIERFEKLSKKSDFSQQFVVCLLVDVYI